MADESNSLILKLIQDGKTNEAIDAFKKLNLSNEFVKNLSLIEAESNALNQDTLKGIISSNEKHIRKNRINDRLITLLQSSSGDGADSNNNKGNTRRINLILGVFFFLGFCLAYWAVTSFGKLDCPDFSESTTNKILLLPFENVGNEKANPQLVLLDKIQMLTDKNKLSTSIKLADYDGEITISEAPNIAKQCDANVIVWGKYSANSGSINLILQYHFLDVPEWSNYGDLISLKDVTEIQKGQMTKKLEDSIMSLCSIIAVRQGNEKITKKWLDKIENKEEVDEKIFAVISN